MATEFHYTQLWAGGPTQSGCDISDIQYTEVSGADTVDADAGFAWYDLNLARAGKIWNLATSDGNDHLGPRFAGVRAQSLPIQLTELPEVIDSGGYNVDSDGDGLINLWDNCDFRVNYGWVDKDNNGIGDACE